MTVMGRYISVNKTRGSAIEPLTGLASELQSLT